MLEVLQPLEVKKKKDQEKYMRSSIEIGRDSGIISQKADEENISRKSIKFIVSNPAERYSKTRTKN